MRMGTVRNEKKGEKKSHDQKSRARQLSDAQVLPKARMKSFWPGKDLPPPVLSFVVFLGRTAAVDDVVEEFSSWNVTALLFVLEELLLDLPVFANTLPRRAPTATAPPPDDCGRTAFTSGVRENCYSMPCCCLRASKLALRSSRSSFDLAILSGWW